MIPKTIHYCWFGNGEMPEQSKRCLASWHKMMPDWDYRLWNEDSFDIGCNAYVREAYEAHKYAFVSDYVRLWVLEREGGLYLDTDVDVFRSFEDLLEYKAFAGFEGSKHLPVGTCVIASEASGEWVKEMLTVYDGLHFIKPDGTPDLTTNVQRLTAVMAANRLRQDGIEQEYKDLHIFPVDYFCPRQTTGEYFRTANTYCDHLGMGTWYGEDWKSRIVKMFGEGNGTRLIKLKRKLFG